MQYSPCYIFSSKRQISSATLGILLDYITANTILSIRQAGCNCHYLQTEFQRAGQCVWSLAWGDCLGEDFLWGVQRGKLIYRHWTPTVLLWWDMNRVKVCVFLLAWRFIWEQGKEGKNLCKLSWCTIHLFPQPAPKTNTMEGGIWRVSEGGAWSFQPWRQCQQTQEVGEIHFGCLLSIWFLVRPLSSLAFVLHTALPFLACSPN